MGALADLSANGLAAFIGYIVFLAVVGYIVSTLYQAFFGPISGIPGPWLAKITRLWELHEVAKGHFEQTNIALHEKYGPIVRIGPNKFSISDPSAVKTLYAAGSKFPKSQFYYAFGDPRPGHANMFSETDIHNHSQVRRRLASLYSMTALVSYEPYVDRCNEMLCRKLVDIAMDGKPFEVQQWMQFYAFDVIGEITTSKSFGFLEKGWDHNTILSSIHLTLVYGSRIGIFPELHKWIALITQLLRMKIPIDVLQSWVLEQIAAKNGKENDENTTTPDRSDFIDKVFALIKLGKATENDVLQAAFVNIGAGSDTISITLSSIIYGLCQNPTAAKKLQEEIDTFTTEGKLSDPVTFEEAGRMPYLQACIKEGLRIHPAVGRPLLRVVPAGGAKLAGQYFPDGSVVGVNAWALHRNEDIFGPDPKEFRPERWLIQDTERLSSMEQNFLSFGGGSRTCIGKNISLLEIAKVIPQLYRNFEFKLVEPNGEMTSSEDWFVKQQFKCFVKVRS